LYLVLVAVGDEHGLSYYSDRSLARLLSLTEAEIVSARRQLAGAELIAYEDPLYQVLALPEDSLAWMPKGGAAP
jgi:hypothetical protein